MEVKVVAGDVAKIETGAVILSIFEGGRPEAGLAAVDKALAGAVSQLISQGEIKGKSGEITLIHTMGKLPATRIVIVGLGKQKELTLDKVRGAVAEVCRFLRKRGVDSAATVLLGAGTADISRETAALAITEGALLGTYSSPKSRHPCSNWRSPARVSRAHRSANSRSSKAAVAAA